MTDDHLALAQTVGLELALSETVAAPDDAGSPAPAGVTRAAREERFTVGREIGRGGMGRVLEASDHQFRRTVALKEMLPGGGAAAKKRFVTEALVTGNLEHPGIPAVYERGERADGSSYYAMQLVSGRTLADALEETTSLEERVRLVPAVVKVAETVAYAHDRGVVHRDLKPENVLLGKHGQVFLLDWGIAKVRGLASIDEGGAITADGAKTQVGAVMGSPMYMAPEQARGATDAIDERTDVFALGAMLYHVLTGRAPYQGKTLQALAAQAVAARPPAVTELVSGVHPELAAICAKAMQREPNDRHATALDLAAALETFQSRGAQETPSKLVSGVLNTGLAAAALMALSLLIAGLVAVSLALQHAGAMSYAALFSTTVGLALAVVEYRTRGDTALVGVGLAVAAVTLFVAGVQTTVGVIHTLGAALGPDAPTEVLPYLKLLTEGLSEAGYSPLISPPLALAQLMVWALVARRNTVLRRSARLLSSPARSFP